MSGPCSIIMGFADVEFIHRFRFCCYLGHAAYRPPPRIKDRAGKFLGRQDRRGSVSQDRGAASCRQLGASEGTRRDRDPSNDFSFYDQVLDTSVLVGAIPQVYGWKGDSVSLATYFAMARGAQGDSETCEHGHAHHHGHGVPAQEMTKWFDTNYHYMVPEFSKDQTFALSSTKPIDEYKEAKALGYQTRPVLVGPVTFLKLGKSHDASFSNLSLLDKLVPVYAEVLKRLAAEGAEWVQIDEPVLVLDLDGAARDALKKAYADLAKAVPQVKIMLNTYFGALGDNLDTAASLPVAGLHIDLIRAPEQLEPVLKAVKPDVVLSLGVIDGRNIWRANRRRSLIVSSPS
jgi:5-methyltetrahydropteroyltriglutamate--homocysteine methyltransferase